MSTELENLEKLIGLGTKRTILIDGVAKEITIRQIRTGQIPKLIKAASGLIPMLMDKTLKVDPIQLMLFHAEECLAMLAVMLNEPKEVVDAMELDDSVLALADCIEVNLDFFAQKVLPLLSGGLTKMLENAKARVSVSDGKTPPSTS